MTNFFLFWRNHALTVVNYVIFCKQRIFSFKLLRFLLISHAARYFLNFQCRLFFILSKLGWVMLHLISRKSLKLNGGWEWNYKVQQEFQVHYLKNLNSFSVSLICWLHIPNNFKLNEILRSPKQTSNSPL